MSEIDGFSLSGSRIVQLNVWYCGFVCTYVLKVKYVVSVVIITISHFSFKKANMHSCKD